MITHLLDRVRSERDRRRWNHAVRYASPGDHATATVIGPGWITWTSGPIRRNPAECPWPDATDAERRTWKALYAGLLVVGDVRLTRRSYTAWSPRNVLRLDLDEDLIPTWDPPMLTQPATALAVAPVGTKVTVWWIRDDDPLMRYAVQGQLVAGADSGEILVGGLDGQAESVPLDRIDAARLGWVTEVTR